MPLVYHIFAPRFLKCGAESADNIDTGIFYYQNIAQAPIWNHVNMN